MISTARSTLGATLLLALFPATLAAQERGAPASPPPRVSLPLTEVRTLHSKIVGADYLLYVSLLRLETHVFEGETHGSCIPAAISRALRALYAPPPEPAKRAQ